MTTAQFALAFAILASTWGMLRRQAGGGTLAALIPLDVAPIVMGWAMLLSITQRPDMSAVIIAAAGVGLALADAVKRVTLREPLVFADRAELFEVVLHPRLYLPFAGPVKVMGGALAAVLVAAGLVWFEPRAPSPAVVIPALLIGVLVLLPTRITLIQRIASFYRALGATGDPAMDMRRFGFLAGLVVQATIARAERPQRRAAIQPFGILSHGDRRDRDDRPGPVIMVQIESFFDARRIGPSVPRDLLPAFDRMRFGATRHGLLEVPCWGANTVRSEFAALTGIGRDDLGLDRFNPYERFALRPLRSIAWEMKRAGYRTICLHPFDKRFYARNRVMPQLGFDEFRGLEVFRSAERAGPYVTDEAVGREALRIARTEGPQVFVFAITIANHGPWDAGHKPFGADGPADRLPEQQSLNQFLDGLRGSDQMIAALMDEMPQTGLLAVYGDHQPSLPGAFVASGFTDPRTDYAIWQPHGVPAPPRTDIPIEDIPHVLLRHLALPAVGAAASPVPA